LIFERKNQAKAILYRLYSILPERLRQLNARYTYALETLHALSPPGWEGEAPAEPAQVSLPEVAPAKNGYIEDLQKNREKAPSIHGVDEAQQSAIRNPQSAIGLPEPNFLFDVMDQRELEKLFNTDRFYAPGEIVFHEAERADGAYLVKSGHVRVARHHDDQRQDFNRPSMAQSKDSHEETLLATLASGSIIGEMALIDDAERSATIVSEGATLGYLSKETFDQIMEQDVELSHKLLLTLCGTMLARISKLNQSYLQVESEIRRCSQWANGQMSNQANEQSSK
jgi:CRP-like cAMP-binding protein